MEGKNKTPLLTSEVIDKYIERVDISQSIIQEQFKILIESIMSIEEQDLWVKFEESQDAIEQVERTFTYELYRQWKNKLIERNSEYTINAEIGKKLAEDIKNSIQASGYKIKYPDFVLHKGQGNIDEHNQLIICEVKKSNSEKCGICKDFETFEWFMKESCSYKYAYAVFIQLNKSLSEISTIINKAFYAHFTGNYKHPIDTSRGIGDRIICVSFDPRKEPNNRLEIMTIKELI